MNNAEKISCDVLYKPESSKYFESIRIFQGCPTIAVTKGGRIYLGWYAGGLREPHMNNYNLLIYSDDKGATWSEPLLVIPSSYENNVHALDIQLFIDPDGSLHVLWVQNNTSLVPENKPNPKPGQPLVFVDGYMFNDFKHSEWEVVCKDPDAENPVFTEPRYLYQGFLRCKPTFLNNGDWLCFAYDQLTDRYGYSISSDKGETFTHYYGPKKLATYFDEAMAYQLSDGSVRMFARNTLGGLSECYSFDNGRTWSDAVLSEIVAANTRFYVKKLPSGRVLLIYNNCKDVTCNMTISLSEDDGKTWKYSKCIDTRKDISYPDADYYDGKIYLTYDRGRTTDKEILFTSFTEKDVIEDNEINVSVLSKPPIAPSREEIIKAVEDNKIIATLRAVPEEKLVSVAEALYNGGIRLLGISYSSDESISDEETAKSIEKLANLFKGRLYIGAGDVLTDEQVRLTKDAGGAFVISPTTDKKVIQQSYRCGLVSIAGALTPTEINEAHNFGTDFVKLSSVSNLGTEYIKSTKTSLSHVKLLAVGGINENNVIDYLKAGVCGFEIESNIAAQKMIDNDDYNGITELAKKYAELIENY